MDASEVHQGPVAHRGAPGELELVRAFINTCDLESGPDALATPESAAAWLAERDLLPARARLSEPERATLVEVREALRALAGTNAGDPPDSAAIEALNRASAEAPVLVGFEADGSSWLEPAGAGGAGAVGRLLGIVLTSMADGSWARLKTCRKDTCRWAFYDHSKNRSSQWCSMRVCGNRVKTRAYRARHRA